jgi:hypothetical protein
MSSGMVERIEQLIGFDRVEGFCIQHTFIGIGRTRIPNTYRPLAS